MLRDHVRRGRFTEAVVLGSRLLGLGVGHGVAGAQHPTASWAPRTWRWTARTSPSTPSTRPWRSSRTSKLDGLRTSPTVMRALEAARERRTASEARQHARRGARPRRTPDRRPRAHHRRRATP
ncbi:MAG: hypothetical protein IPN77_19260 [Sandaracinaceae bacterium]|nr:hypothetical protein [Sandaracinaceae bacterium]